MQGKTLGRQLEFQVIGPERDGGAPGTIRWADTKLRILLIWDQTRFDKVIFYLVDILVRRGDNAIPSSIRELLATQWKYFKAEPVPIDLWSFFRIVGFP